MIISPATSHRNNKLYCSDPSTGIFVSKRILGNNLLASFNFQTSMIISQSTRTLPESEVCGSYPPSPEPLYHLTCKQLFMARIHNDEVLLNHMPLTKLIILGRIITADKGTSPKGMVVINATIVDSTGQAKVMIYYRENIQQICKSGEYVKLGVTIKCGGLPYRPQIKLVCHTVKLVEQFEELTEHYLECMKASLIIRQ